MLKIFNNHSEIVGSFLFGKENIEKKKEVLLNLWKKREKIKENTQKYVYVRCRCKGKTSRT